MCQKRHLWEGTGRPNRSNFAGQPNIYMMHSSLILAFCNLEKNNQLNGGHQWAYLGIQHHVFHMFKIGENETCPVEVDQ